MHLFKDFGTTMLFKEEFEFGLEVSPFSIDKASYHYLEIVYRPPAAARSNPPPPLGVAGGPLTLVLQVRALYD